MTRHTVLRVDGEAAGWRGVVLCGVVATLAALALLPGEAVRSARTTADEPQYLLSATSLAEDLDLDIADELAAERWRTYHAAQLPRQTEPTADGIEISPHDPGLPVLLAAPVAIGGWIGAKVALALCNGLLAGLLAWTALCRFGVDRRVAVPAVMAFTCAPPLATYGAQVYPELPAAVCIAGIIALAGATRHRRAALATTVSLAVAAMWLSVKYAPVVAVAIAIASWQWWRRGERRDALVAVSALAVLGVVYVALHARVYGGLTPYAAGDFFAANGGQLSVMGDNPNRLARTQRLSGLLVDRDFGLAAWQPAYLLAVPALGALAVRRPPHWALLGAPLAAGWAVATWVAVTMHGWWWPGRHVVHALPGAVLVVAWWLARLRRGVVVAWVAASVGVVSTLWLAADAALGDVTLVFDPWATTNPVHHLVRPLLPDLRADRPVDAVLLALWSVALIAAAALAARHAGSTRPPAAPSHTSVFDDVVAEVSP